MKPLVIMVPVRTKNPMNMQTGNSKLAAIIRTKQRAMVRNATLLFVSSPIRAALPKIRWPVRVTLTRLSSGRMDDDGIAACVKSCRDSIAQVLGVDDGDAAKIRFQYEGRKCKRGEYGIEVRIESAS